MHVAASMLGCQQSLYVPNILTQPLNVHSTSFEIGRLDILVDPLNWVLDWTSPKIAG